MDLLIQDQIVELLEQERYFEATGLLDRYLRLEGKDEFYYLAASDVRMGMEEYEAVLTLLEEAMETGLDNPMVWERMAEAMIGLEDFTGARELLEQVLASGEAEDELRDLFNLGRCHLAELDYRQAAACFEDILLEEDNSETVFLLGMAYGGGHQFKRMRENFDLIIQDPEYTTRILDYLTFQDDITALCDYVFSTGGSKATLLLYVSRWYFSHDSHKEAAEYLEQAAVLEENPLLMATAVLMHSQAGSQARARKLFWQLMDVTADADEPDVFASIRLEALESLGYSSRTSQKAVHQILDITSSHPDARIRCAEYALANDMPQDAYSLLEEVPADLTADREQDWFNARIAACLQSERYQEAYRYLKDRKGYKDRTYRKNLAIASYCTGRSLEALSESLAILPDGIGAIIAFLIYDERGEQEQAAGILERMRGALAKEEPIDDLSNFIGFLEEMGGDAA